MNYKPSNLWGSHHFGHDVSGKRFITHGGRNPRYKYLGRGIFQFADSVLSLPVK